MHSDISGLDYPYTIPTSDHYTIHGILNAPTCLSVNSTSSKLVVIPVMKEQDIYGYFAQAQRKYYNARGYDVVRLALSHSAQDTRDFKEITLGHMASDIRTACEKLHLSYDHVFIAAHGLVAFAAAMSNAECEGQSLYEPCFVPYENFVESSYAYRRNLDVYQNLLNPMEYLSPRLVESCKLFDHDSCRKMLQSIDRPTQFIWAEKGFGKNMSGLYKAYLNTHAQSVIISDADHRFNIGNTIDKACEQSDEWFTYCASMYEISALGITSVALHDLPTNSVN